MTKNGTAKDQKGTMPHFVQSSLVQRRCHCQLLSWKLLMWPFDKVLWWCCRPKGIPRDRHGEAPRVSDSVVCRSLRQAFQSRPPDPGGRLNQVGHTEKYKYEIRAYEIGLNLFQVSVYTSQIHVNFQHCARVNRDATTEM